MAHYHIDLAFTSDAALLGSNFGRSSTYYPLQYALVDGSNSRFNMGPNGGLAGGDSFDINVYDITSVDQGTPAGQDVNATVSIFGQFIIGSGEIRNLLASYPTGSTLTPTGEGLAYSGLSYGTGNSAAYGNGLPVYSVNAPSQLFTLVDPSSSVAIKLSFGFEVWGKVYIVDPEMVFGRGGG